MPPKLKVLSGSEVVAIFGEFGFIVYSQRGSHVKLKRTLQNNIQTLTVPNHKEIARGTLRAIYSQALRYIPGSDLQKYFYTE